MPRYLVPLDGSDLAEQALPFAKERAQRNGSSIVLVRVVNIARQLAAASMSGQGIEPVTPVAIETVETAIQLEVDEAKAYLEKKAQQLQREGLVVEWEVRQGPPAGEIIACAKEKDVDVVVITTHGRSGLGRLVFGSVADHVIREGGIPVLVINPK
ncbi:MAG: universal stress protein [Chloroflexi bacterium]|nr:universal stress protein [Chloroflexota bacterium]